MSRSLFFVAALLCAAAALPAQTAFAQGRPSDDDRQEQDQAKKKKRDAEFGDIQAPLPQLRNAGPCPYVKVLYDAGRYLEFKDGKEASANVAYSGEIQSISAGCAYKDTQPIALQIQVLFELGRGPQAVSDTKTYRYWVAVTQRNEAVIAKEYFNLPVRFQPGQDRIYVTEDIHQVVIPRAKLTTSGSNFEVLVGFDVTPQMAEFNRLGKRFRLTAGVTGAQTNQK
ncbi:MAG: Tat pathway signal sequence domain protein [Phenylobacterium zucineum]|nr:MAG: Tat pathway signal sequence domain protein [Phenylobacterium zucineum]